MFNKYVRILFFMWALFFTTNVLAQEHQAHVEGLLKWLKENRDPENGMPYSHVGDERFKNWTILYDSAVTVLAYIAGDEDEAAKKIADYYLETPGVWRLGGIIECFIPSSPIQGKDWSIRAGANTWMGLAFFHLYKKTQDPRYLQSAKKIAEMVLSLQNKNDQDPNFGGISLGPKGNPAFPADQYLSYNINMPQYCEIYSTEINLDTYALCHWLYRETKENTYSAAMNNILVWLKKNAYNIESHRFNRGYDDETVATDVQSWAISALGVDVLDTFEKNGAEKIIAFIEKECTSEVLFKKPDGTEVKLKGTDFVCKNRLSELGRGPLVSPEWTFQLINALERMNCDFTIRNEQEKAKEYQKKKDEFIQSMMLLAIPSGEGLAYPYATQGEAVIGHEYQTPKPGNLSNIGASYGVLALTGFDPLNADKFEKK